ncbi:MAG: hypothetical protein ACE5IJ_07140, partial [Thermoplasmata archaeon]
WNHKHSVIRLLHNLILVREPETSLLHRLARKQMSRLADWSLIAVAEELSRDEVDAYVVSNDTTVAGDIEREDVACHFLDDESFLRLVMSLAELHPGVMIGHLVTVYSRVRDSIANRAGRDQEWYRELSIISAKSERLINRILEAYWREQVIARVPAVKVPPRGVPLARAAPPVEAAPPIPMGVEREMFRYNVTYSGDPERGTERGIVMLGSPGSRRRDRLPKGWVRLMANGVAYWGKFVKIALNVVKEKPTESRHESNLLDGILRSWFGREGILPGEPVCHVGFRHVRSKSEDKLWEMYPSGFRRRWTPRA